MGNTGGITFSDHHLDRTHLPPQAPPKYAKIIIGQEESKSFHDQSIAATTTLIQSVWTQKYMSAQGWTISA
jgi:hypothetical protein